MAGNKVYVQGSYIDVHDNEVVNLSVDKAEVRMGDNGRQVDESRCQPKVPTLVACVAEVREYLWSDSSMAVIFCVCRDCYGYVNNMSQFERDFRCSEGLLASTFQNNPFMRLNIGRWEKNGVKARVQRLVEAYKNAVTERLGT